MGTFLVLKWWISGLDENSLKKYNIIVILLFFAFLSTASAVSKEQCSSFDLRKKGQSLYQAPQYSQGSTEYCWAFAGTQLANSLLNLKNQKSFQFPTAEISLSPTVTMNHALTQDICQTPCGLVNSVLKSKRGCSFLDVEYNTERGPVNPDTGMPRPTFKKNCNLAHKSNLQEIEENIFRMAQSVVDDLGGLRNKISYLANRFGEKNSSLSSIERQRALSRLMQMKIDQTEGLKLADFYNLATAPKCMGLGRANAEFVGSKNIQRLLKDEQENRCQSFGSYEFNAAMLAEQPECKNSPAQTLEKDKVFQNLNQAFNKSAIYPIAIDYCYAFLYDGTVTPSSRLCQFKDGKNTTDHKSLLIGRRYNEKTGNCEFLLRNSKGKECSGYHESFRNSCEQELKVNQMADVWVSDEILSKAVHGYSVLE